LLLHLLNFGLATLFAGRREGARAAVLGNGRVRVTQITYALAKSRTTTGIAQHACEKHGQRRPQAGSTAIVTVVATTVLILES
jgi:hypothetical protein